MMLKRVAVISAVAAFGGLVAIGCGLFTAHLQTFYVGCAITMVALSCAINANMAIINRRNDAIVDGICASVRGAKSC